MEMRRSRRGKKRMKIWETKCDDREKLKSEKGARWGRKRR
jgi:hypothetical protein